jgi:hypothetical protein
MQTSATPQVVKCPCTLERDPLVSGLLLGGVPNNMIPDLRLGVGALQSGTLATGFGPTTAIQAYNALVTTWGPGFGPKDFTNAGVYVGPK